MKKEKYKISVIVPIYNVQKYISQCIDSIIEQTYCNLEILLIDDGSTDNSGDICDKYSKCDKRIKVIHKENGGLSSSRNEALQILTGDLVSFVDGDDWIDKELYSKAVSMIDKTHSDIVYFDFIKTDGVELFGASNECMATGTVITGEEFTKRILQKKIGCQITKGVYKKELFDGIYFPLGRLYEDIATTFKITFNAKKVVFIDETLYMYRINNCGISLSPNKLKSLHIFYGFKEHYEFSKMYYPELTVFCKMAALEFAISTYMHYCSDAHEELQNYINEVVCFIDSCKNEVDYKMMRKTKKISLKIYYLSPSFFAFLFHFIYKTKLQNIIGIQSK